MIPNGVDTDYFQPFRGRFGTDTPVIGFTGDMGYFPNQEAVIYFARKVLPLIRRSVPDARFLIVGRNPNRKVRDLAEIEGVEVTGFVPDVRPHLARMTGLGGALLDRRRHSKQDSRGNVVRDSGRGDVAGSPGADPQPRDAD